MRLFVLLMGVLLTQTSYGDVCSDLQSRLQIGGTRVALSSVQSPLIKEAFQRILNSSESRVRLPLACDDSAIGYNGKNTFGGIFLLKGDAVSTWLLREYALNGDLTFDKEYTQVLSPEVEEFGTFKTLFLLPALVPARVPGLVGNAAFFSTYERLNDEVYSESVSVLVDKETREAIVYKFRAEQ